MDVSQVNSEVVNAYPHGSLNSLRDVLKEYETHTQLSDQLVQLWTLTEDVQDNYVLECISAPYISGQSEKLKHFRNISTAIKFPVSSAANTSMLGRVFTSGCAEFCPDIRLYDDDEYKRLSLARQCGIKATVGIGFYSPKCKGVLELVMFKHLDSYYFSSQHRLLLEALNHKGFHTGFCNPTLFRMISEDQGLQATEIIVKKLQEVCDLLVCQTWAVYFTSSLARSNGEKSGIRLRCKGLPVAVSGMYLEDFHEFSSKVTLKGDQAGLLGEVVAGQQSIAYCSDMCKLSTVDYALAPVARWFDLHCCCAFGMKLPSVGDEDDALDPDRRSYIVLECFMPKCCPSPDANTEANIRTEQVQLLISTIRSTADALGIRLSLPAGGVEHLVLQAHLLAEPKMNTLDTLPFTSQAESRVSKTSTGLVKRKPGTGGERYVSFAVLKQHLQYDLQTAAKKIGVSATTLKKICRQNGILRWPRRTLNKARRAPPEKMQPPEAQEPLGEFERPEPQQQQKQQVAEQQGSESHHGTTDGAAFSEQAPITMRSVWAVDLPGEEVTVSSQLKTSDMVCNSTRDMDSAGNAQQPPEQVQQLPVANAPDAADDQCNAAHPLEGGLDVAHRIPPFQIPGPNTAGLRVASPLLAGDSLSSAWQTEKGISQMLGLSPSPGREHDPAEEAWEPTQLGLPPSPKAIEEAMQLSLEAQPEPLRKRPCTRMDPVSSQDLPIFERYFNNSEQQRAPLSFSDLLMTPGIRELLQEQHSPQSAVSLAEVDETNSAHNLQAGHLLGRTARESPQHEIPQMAAFSQDNSSLAASAREILAGRHAPSTLGPPPKEVLPGCCEQLSATQANQKGSLSTEGGCKNGFIIVKAQMDNIIVRCKHPLEGEGSGYQGLLQRMAGRFKHPLKDIRLQYVDDEGDLITLMCDEDWMNCIETNDQSQSRVFKLLVSLNSS